MTLISRKLIDDQDLVARYLANQLSDSERESFEAYFIEHPEVLKDLNRTAQFKSGLATLRDEGLLDTALAPSPWWRSTRSIAAAASLMVLAFVGYWLLSQQPVAPLIAGSPSAFIRQSATPLSVASSHIVQRTRTTSFDATIERPKPTSVIELRVRPETATPSSRYRVSMGRMAENNSIQPISEIGGLRPDAEGLVPGAVPLER